MALSNHVTHYGSRSGFPYYTPITPTVRSPGDALNIFVDLNPGNLHQCPDNPLEQLTLPGDYCSLEMLEHTEDLDQYNQ